MEETGNDELNHCKGTRQTNKQRKEEGNTDSTKRN